MAVTFILFVVNICIASSRTTASTITTPVSLGYKPIRPSYAGATGGNWVGDSEQRVPPGKPWPAKPENYSQSNVPATAVTLMEELITPSELPVTNSPPFDPSGSQSVPLLEPEPARPENNESFSSTWQKPLLESEANRTSTISSAISQSTSSPEDETLTSSKLPESNRPPFLGPTGGNFIPERVPPGKPLPARPEDEDFIVTSQKPTLKPQNEVIASPKPPKPNRPPFLGPTGGNFIPERVPPGKPLPAGPEDYEGSNVTSQKPTLKPQNEVITSPRPPIPNRPPFLGPTGGNYIPERVPPGKPLPTKPEDNKSFNVTPQTSISQISTASSVVDHGILKPENEVVTVPKLPVPNRPPYLGPTGGNYIPERVPPGKPWPARPEDYEGFSVTSQKPSLKPQNEVITSSKPPIPNRPPFLGPTGGNYIPERVPPGKPWPARPEDYESFSVTSQKPSLKPQNEVITSSKPPIPNRPPFLGPTGGNYIPEKVPPGQPWPARPEDYEGFSVTSQKPTLKPQNEVVTSSKPPIPNRPPFLGPTGGNYIPEKVPPGQPWPARPEDYEGFSVTSQKPIQQTTVLSTTSSEIDQGTLKPVVTSPKLPAPNRPPFLGPTGGNFIPERVPPGKPLPAKPEDSEGFSVTSQKPGNPQIAELSTTSSVIDQGTSKPENEVGASSKPPVPNRPPFIGATGGNFIPERIPPGKPLPAKPEDYENFSATSQKPVLHEEINEATIVSSVSDPGTLKPQIEVITSPKPALPNRPSFLGPTGGNFIPETPESVPPGKPLPARPEESAGFDITSEKPSIAQISSNTCYLNPQNIPNTTTEVSIPSSPPVIGSTEGDKKPEDVQDASITFPEDRKSNDYKNTLVASVLPQSSNIDTTYFYLDSGETTKLKLSTQQQVADVDTAKKPSLSISFNIDAFKAVGGSSTVRDEVPSKESSPIEDTKQFLSTDKVNNIGQNKDFLTFSIKFGDFISSSKKLSAARFSVAQVLNTSLTSDPVSGEMEPQALSENQSHVKPEQNGFNDVLRKPLLSIFVNLKDFRKTNKDSSLDNNKESDKKTII